MEGNGVSVEEGASSGPYKHLKLESKLSFVLMIALVET